jgi:CDP-6-deoxy-D-xylo-4-hexulose-3-dehydrase
MSKSPAEIKAEILRLTREFSAATHAANRPGGDPARLAFVHGQTTVPYAGRVFTEDEVEAAVSATLDFWLTLGPEGDAFEKEFAGFLGVKKSILVNSGSSANLLAFSALTSEKLGERRLRPGDEVITVAAGFPTTVAPILQNGCVPVFIDNDPATLNGRPDQLESAFTPGKTKAVMMAHTLGNPFDLAVVTEFCKRNNLWLIEDNCDALGCRYDGKFTGTFGDLSTQSFYPPHHLTMGEGGAVNVVRDMKLKVLAESFRDWGRDCWCASGKDNTCNKRFGWQLGELPEGYDHKYIYSHLGYNLKPLDIQAAIGRAQLRKLPGFIEARKRNWQILRRALAPLEEFFTFQLPTHATGWTGKAESGKQKAEMAVSTFNSQLSNFSWDSTGHRTECSWFGFMMLVKKSAPFTRGEFVKCLDAAKIGNRMLFGGNLVRQPAFVSLRQQQPNAFRIVGDLAGADRIMNEAVFIGVYPGLTQVMLDYMIETITKFARAK